MKLKRDKSESSENDSVERPESDAAPTQSAPKYPRPKILLVDLPDSAAELLRQSGYNVAEGTLGTPMEVARSDKYSYVPVKANLPGYTEQEIIAIDFKDPEPTSEPPEDASPGEKGPWQKMSSGIINPRPVTAAYIHDNLDRIQKHGGIFVFFLADPYLPQYVWGEVRYSDLRIEREVSFSVWEVLREAESVERKRDLGSEIDVPDSSRHVLVPHLQESSFSVTIDRPYNIEEKRWIPLARSKFGGTVAAIIAPEEGEIDGWVFLLPQAPRKGEVLKDLIEDFLPRLRPQLFPHIEGKIWIEQDQYQLPRVRELQQQVAEVERDADQKISELRDEISAEREKYSFLHGILTGTGDELVEAVIETLKLLGFQDVRDVDKEEGSSGNGEGEKATRKREDIQIHDRSPLVLGEVKGIVNLPKEAGALQVFKYLAPRMKQLDRTDIHGLSIINHQRGLPPVDRERENVFQDDVVTNAEEQGFGLLTTFDLYRLARGYLRHGWQHEDVVELFYEEGRMEPIPKHYEFIGVIDGFWQQAEAVGLRLEKPLAVGDRIVFELPLDFEEQPVESIQLDDEDVESAEAGQHIGVKTQLTKSQARNGVRILQVRSE